MTGGFSMDFADAQHGIVWGGNWEAKQTPPAAVTADGGKRGPCWPTVPGPGMHPRCGSGRDRRAGNSPSWAPPAASMSATMAAPPGGVSDSAFYAARFSPSGETLWLCGNGRLGRIGARALGW